ncbi:MAG: hypothetical protein KDA83_15665 [Planctomycetales bacterium]|nr:hypothetical protein [Planctomycetales bacterium]
MTTALVVAWVVGMASSQAQTNWVAWKITTVGGQTVVQMGYSQASKADACACAGIEGGEECTAFQVPYEVPPCGTEETATDTYRVTFKTATSPLGQTFDIELPKDSEGSTHNTDFFNPTTGRIVTVRVADKLGLGKVTSLTLILVEENDPAGPGGGTGGGTSGGTSPGGL